MLSFDSISLLRSEKTIVHNFSYSFLAGTTNALIGPNGSGKSSLALALMGHPALQVEGSIVYNGHHLLDLPAEKRARLGIFVSFQHPLELPGVSVRTFLRESQRACGIEVSFDAFVSQLAGYLAMVGLPQSYADRSFNVGFSGGEKKRVELLTMLMLKPSLVVLDELDSGLDSEGIECLITSLTHWRTLQPQGILIIISHYQALLDRLAVDSISRLEPRWL